LEIYIIAGVLLPLAWLYIYLTFFREKESRNIRTEVMPDEEGFVESVAPVISTTTQSSSPEEGTAYSVAPWGDDGNNGSFASPWKTLQHAVNRLQPGESLIIREGTYKEAVSLKNSGIRGKPVRLSVLQGEEAFLDGEGAGWKYGFNFEFGVSFVMLSGLKVKNFAGYGVALWGENHSVELVNLEALGCGTGLHIISASDLLVEESNFHNNSGSGFVVSPGPLNGARITRTRSSFNESSELPGGFVLDSGRDILFEKCTAEYNDGNGFSCLTERTTVLACTVRHNDRYGVECAGEGTTLINCLIDSNGSAGVALSGGGLHKLINNLTVNCGLKGDYGLVAAPDNSPSPIRVWLINNIFAYNYGGVHFGSTAILEKEDHNIFWSREDAEISTDHRRYSRVEINEPIRFEETGRGEHSFCKDPLFVDPSGHDYRLARNSPAIDRGAREGAPDTDMNGNNRPQGRGVDIGPFESAEGSLIPPISRLIFSPAFSSDTSVSPKFSIKWEGQLEGRKVAGFNVQCKAGYEGSWQNWLADTSESQGEFLGVSGHTYYFRVRAKDDLGNWGYWSNSRYTVVPIDDQSPLIKYEGDWDLTNSEESYLGTSHYSTSPGAMASLRLTGTEASWISAVGPDRGQANVYIDGALQATVDLYSADYQPRRPVFTTRLDGTPHTLRVEVESIKNPQSGGYRVDVDGFAVKS
jgi:hypothetical protein